MQKKQKLVIWLPATLALGVLSVLLLYDKWQLPFHDRSRDIVSWGPGEVAYDSQGRMIENPFGNNPLDDIVKIAVILTALFALWQLLGVFIKSWKIKLCVILIGMPIGIIAFLLAAYALS